MGRCILMTDKGIRPYMCSVCVLTTVYGATKVEQEATGGDS